MIPVLKGGAWHAAGVAVALTLASTLSAQAQATPREERVVFGFTKSFLLEENVEVYLTHGFNLVYGGIELQADRAVAMLDRDEVPDALREDATGLPRRAAQAPNQRRALNASMFASRLRAFSSSLDPAEGSATPATPIPPFALTLLKSLYLEGHVLVTQGGREMMRAQRLHFSTQDDRLILEDAELHLWSENVTGPRLYIVRGARLVRQGLRMTARDVSVTTCSAGEPHFETRVGEIEILQRETDFEVRTADATLAFSGTGVLPLPNTRFFTSEQSSIPIQGVSFGQSGNEGARVQVDLGGSFNRPGGAVHEFLTGRPAHEFRGDWHLGLGYNQERGFPLDGGLTYGAKGLYEGRMLGYYLDDSGRNRREIRRRLDGSVIDEQRRSLFQSENRFYLNEETTLDLTAFAASDPAVYSEFYRREYREEEIPESSAYLRHARDNQLFTAIARINAATFSYADDRNLAPAFVEQLPSVAFNVFSEQIATLGDDIPVLLTSATGADYFRRDYDSTVAPLDDDTLRLDQDLELAVPFHIGALGIRPFVSARATHYGETPSFESKTRAAFAAGVRAATWIARSWSWSNDAGERQALRHVVSPAISLVERFGVTGDPADFFQYDETDALTERTELRLELLNRLQHRQASQPATEFLWLDLAQTITPISSRDNAGHHLGLSEYELIVRPGADLAPVPNLQLVVEGEHDFNSSKERTFNTGVRFGKVLGLNWYGGFRTDQLSDGAILYGASTDLFGRWLVHGGSQYDLGRDEILNYTARVIRLDHDWRISVGVNYSNIDGDTRFFVNFEPTLGGLFKRRRPDYVSGLSWEASHGYQ